MEELQLDLKVKTWGGLFVRQEGDSQPTPKRKFSSHSCFGCQKWFPRRLLTHRILRIYYRESLEKKRKTEWGLGSKLEPSRACHGLYHRVSKEECTVSHLALALVLPHPLANGLSLFLLCLLELSKIVLNQSMGWIELANSRWVTVHSLQDGIAGPTQTPVSGLPESQNPRPSACLAMPVR